MAASDLDEVKDQVHAAKQVKDQVHAAKQVKDQVHAAKKNGKGDD